MNEILLSVKNNISKKCCSLEYDCSCYYLQIRHHGPKENVRMQYLCLAFYNTLHSIILYFYAIVKLGNIPMYRLLLIWIRRLHKLDSYDYTIYKDKFYGNEGNVKCNYCLLLKWITFSRRIPNVYIPSNSEFLLSLFSAWETVSFT